MELKVTAFVIVTYVVLAGVTIYAARLITRQWFAEKLRFIKSIEPEGARNGNDSTARTSGSPASTSGPASSTASGAANGCA